MLLACMGRPKHNLLGVSDWKDLPCSSDAGAYELELAVTYAGRPDYSRCFDEMYLAKRLRVL